MARIVGLMGSIAINNTTLMEHAGLSTVYTQCIRWRRRPRWMPPCKSKMFKIIEMKEFDENETVELQRLYNNYNTYMNTLTEYLAEYYKTSEIQYDENVVKLAFEEDFRKCSEINDEWNKKVAEQRESRLAKERQERRDMILQKLIEKEELEKEARRRTDEQVRKLQEEIHVIITEENIDRAIEEALATTVDHNAAMDLDGNFYPGSEPDVVKKKTQAQA